MHSITYLFYIIIIQVSIFIFVLPFYVLYLLSLKEYSRKISFSRHLEYFLSSKYADYLIFFWAFSEALYWFVIPEFLLLLIIFLRIKKRPKMILYDIYGTIVGILFAFAVNLQSSSVSKLPFVQLNMVEQVHIWFSNIGEWALLYQPFSGVPFKVFNHTAHDFHLNLFFYIFVAIIARIGRYVLLYLFLTNMYKYFHKFVYNHYVKLLLVSTFIFGFLLVKTYLSFGPGYTFVKGL